MFYCQKLKHISTTSMFVKVLIINLSIMTMRVNSDTTWVWGKAQPQGNTGSNFGNSNSGRGDLASSSSVFPESPGVSPPRGQTSHNGGSNSAFPESPLSPSRDRFNNGKGLNSASSSLIPESPSRPANTDNSALPDDSIRVTVGQSDGKAEPRLIPGLQSIVSNTLQTLAGGGSSRPSSGLSNPPSGPGLFSIGNQLITNFLQGVPQLAGGAFNLLLGRPSKGNGASVSTLPASGNSVSSVGNSISSAGGNIPILNPSGSNFGSRPDTNSGNGASNCRCIPLNSCFLPSRPNGDCARGNVQCCVTANRLDGSGGSSSGNYIPESPIRQTRENTDTGLNARAERQLVRSGLLQNIVRGGSNLVDDTLDFLLYRYYTDSDKQRLANRVAKSSL